MSNDTLIQVEHVSKKFCRDLKRSLWYGVQDIGRELLGLSGSQESLRPSEFWAVDDISFEVRRGECLGLIGSNGAGKSTLLKMLNGLIKPDKGRITMRGRVGALIELGTGFSPILTGRENIYNSAAMLGLSSRDVDLCLDEIVAFAELGDALDAPLRTYSSGMNVRLGMAVALQWRPNTLLIDEVFAVGDVRFQARCLNRLGQIRNEGAAMILVSHNLQHIAGYSDRVLVLGGGRRVAFGQPAAALRTYQRTLQDVDRANRSELAKVANGSGRIRLTDVCIAADDRGRTDEVSAVEHVTLQVEYEAYTECQDAELEVIVYLDGVSVFFHASNRLVRERIDISRGSGTIEISFPSLHANRGQLQFAVALWSPRRKELFDWHRELAISISGHPSSSGAVWFPFTMTHVDNRCESAVSQGLESSRS